MLSEMTKEEEEDQVETWSDAQTCFCSYSHILSLISPSKKPLIPNISAAGVQPICTDSVHLCVYMCERVTIALSVPSFPANSSREIFPVKTGLILPAACLCGEPRR